MDYEKFFSGIHVLNLGFISTDRNYFRVLTKTR